MNVKMKYFGVVAEVLGEEEAELELTDGTSVSMLRKRLETASKQLAEIAFQITVNKKLVKEANLRDGDEIALLPPFAGG